MRATRGADTPARDLAGGVAPTSLRRRHVTWRAG
jgi:hypothetical protein